MKKLSLFYFFLFLAVLACNAPITPNGTLPPPPELGGTVQVSPTFTAELLVTENAGTPPPLATFTPIGGSPLATLTLASGTLTIPTPNSLLTPSPNPSGTAESSNLSFTYTIQRTTNRDSNGNLTAQVTISASGGTGEYRYYHDDLLQSGPSFSYKWQACHDNPGSLRVDSGGQSVRINYYEKSPCP